MFIPHQPKKPPTVDKFTNQLKVGIELSDCTQVNGANENLLEDGDSTRRGVHERQECKRTGEENCSKRKTILRAVRQETRGLSSEGETVKHTRRREQEGVSGGEGGGENACVDDVREDLDSGAGNSDDIGGLRCCAARLQKVLVIVGDEHAGDQDTKKLK